MNYLIERSFLIGQHKVLAFIERDSEQMDFKTTVADIATGQVEHVTRVIGFDVASGRCVDATADVAEYVAAHCIEFYGRVPERLREFVGNYVAYA